MAIHAGHAEERAGDYFGPPLNRVARLLATGHGGQVLVSKAAAELAYEQFPANVGLRDLGEHTLKDMDRPERLYQLEAPGLETSFPAARTEQAPSAGDVFNARIDAYVRKELDRALRTVDPEPTEHRGPEWRKLLG
jgi:hypothetical protein